MLCGVEEHKRYTLWLLVGPNSADLKQALVIFFFTLIIMTNTNLSQRHIDALDAHSFSYYLAYGTIDSTVEAQASRRGYDYIEQQLIPLHHNHLDGEMAPCVA